MRIRATAPGKLVLLGEYALFEGAPAIVAAVDPLVKAEMVTANRRRGISVDISHLNTGPIPVHPGGANLSGVSIPKHKMEQVRTIVSILKTTKMWDYAVPSAHRASDLVIDAGPFFSDHGKKYGFGSSAAITVSIAGLADYLVQSSTVSRKQLLGRAIEIHRSLQSDAGSGIDIAASTMGGILKFQLDSLSAIAPPTITRLEKHNKIRIGAVWTGQSASTASFLAAMAHFKARRPNAYDTVMQRLVEICTRGVVAYQEKRTRNFLAAIDNFCKGLEMLSLESDLPIFSPVHRKLARIARENGGFYKPSGAGGGDIGLYFAESVKVINQIDAELTRSGYQVFDLQWGVEGFRLTEGND